MTHRAGTHAIVRACCLACALQGGSLSCAASLAEIVPVRGIVDSRVRTAVYESDQVYRLRGFVGYQIDFEFESGETFVGLGAGDIEGLAYFGAGQPPVLEAKGRKGRDQSHRAHQAPAISDRLHGRAGASKPG